MSKKKLIIVAIALVAVIAALVTVYFVTRPKPQEGQKTITVTVVHKEGEPKSFTYTTNENYLGPVLRAEGLVVGHEDGGSFFVDAVDGEEAVYTAENPVYWQVFEGDAESMVGVDQIALKDGGVYKLVFTTYTADIQEPPADGGLSHSGGSND